MHTMIKIGDTLSDSDEGLNAGMWTVAVARTGNRLTNARRKLGDAGAQNIVDSAADSTPVLEPIGERLAKGERP